MVNLALSVLGFQDPVRQEGTRSEQIGLFLHSNHTRQHSRVTALLCLPPVVQKHDTTRDRYANDMQISQFRARQ